MARSPHRSPVRSSNVRSTTIFRKQISSWSWIRQWLYCFWLLLSGRDENALERHNRRGSGHSGNFKRLCMASVRIRSIMAATIDGKPITKFATTMKAAQFRSSRLSRAIARMEAKTTANHTYPFTGSGESDPSGVDSVLHPAFKQPLLYPRNLPILDKDRQTWGLWICCSLFWKIR